MGRNPDLEVMYHNSLAIVLGGAGFVGHMLVRELLVHGANVVVVDNFSRGRNIVRGATYIPVDITQMDSPAVVEQLPQQADYIFNLAAFVAGVEYNKGHQGSMYDENIILGTAPLEWAALTGACYMCTSSVCVYPEDKQIMSLEKDAFNGIPQAANMGYSMAKRDSELALINSDVEHGVIVRPSNIIGPRDYYDERAHVLPHLVKRAFAAKESGSETLEVWGSKETQREFIHSFDAARGMMFALAFGEDKEAYNIGTNGRTEVSIGTLALMVSEIVPVGVDLVFNGSVGGGDLRRTSNAYKLMQLGWKHTRSVEDAVVDAIDTYTYSVHPDSSNGA